MKTISSARKSPKKRPPSKKTIIRRKFKRQYRKIRNYIMDAYRNAKSIGELFKKMDFIERRLSKTTEVSSEIEARYYKTVNTKLLLLIGLWILDKIVLLFLFKWFNAV